MVYADGIRLGNYSSGAFKGFDWYHSQKGCWPSAMVGTLDQDNIPTILEKVESGNLPPFFIADRTHTKTIDALIKNGFYEVTRWMGMYLLKDDFLYRKVKDEAIVIKSIQVETELTQWADLVHRELLKNKTIENRLFQGWLRQDNYVLMGAYSGNQLVSAGLVCITGKSAGVYFIATDEKFRGAGIASALVSRLLEQSFEQGVEKVFLQASIKAETLYGRLGFKSAHPISVFWKMGMV